jgi:uncharacterized protein YdeI (YjbR/CyaY-like superfamily)
MAPDTSVEPELVRAKDRATWRRWLQRNHSRTAGVWLELHKKGSRSASVTYEEAVLEALCFGWVDAKANKLDEERFKLWMSPRKAHSVWSAINKGRVAELTDAGLMAPPGLAAVNAAKADGSWMSLEASDALIVAEDLETALAAVAHARSNFDGFPPGVRKQILQWINSAKRPETRAKRVEETARHAGENVRANQWRR